MRWKSAALAASVVAITSIALSSCSSGGATETTSSASSTESQQPAPTTDTGTSTEDTPATQETSSSSEETPTGPPTELTVWLPGKDPAEMDFVDNTVIPAFDKANNAKVTVTYVDWGELSTKLNTAFASNTAPDVWGHGVAATAGFVQGDRVAPLNDYLAHEPQAYHDALDSMIKQGTIDGKSYIVPVSATVNLIVYRSDFLKEAGIDPATLKTWPDVLDAAKKLKTNKRAGLLVGTSSNLTEQTFNALITSAGGSLLSDDGTKVAFNSPEGLKALDFMVSIYQGPDAVGTAAGENYQALPVAQRPLALGTAAMTWSNAGEALQIVTAQPEMADKLGVLPPLSFGADPAPFGGMSAGLFISQDSKNKDLAWKFLEYMSSDEVSTAFAQATSAMPLWPSALQSSYVTDNPILEPFIQALPQGIGNPNIPSWTQVRDLLEQQIQAAIAGKVTSQQALDEAESKIAPLL